MNLTVLDVHVIEAVVASSVLVGRLIIFRGGGRTPTALNFIAIKSAR